MARRSSTMTPSAAVEREPQGSLARGLAVLDHILDASQPQALHQIAAATGLDSSTVHRLLKTLEETGHVIRTGSKSYMASPKALSPLPLMHPLKQLRREAQPILQALANDIGETIVLVVYMDIERMVVEIAQTQGSLTPYYDTWLHGPLHCSGAGKALLLKLDPERRRAVLGPGPFRALTPRTLTSRQALEENLEFAAQRGYATARDEHHMGLTAISANIHDWHHEPLGCLVMTGHSRAFDDTRVESVGETLRRSAELLLFQVPSLRNAATALGH